MLSPDKQRLIVAKVTSNGNHRLSKIETTSKVSLRPTSRINLRKRGACTHRVLDFGHNPQASPPPPQTGKC